MRRRSKKNQQKNDVASLKLSARLKVDDIMTPWGRLFPPPQPPDATAQDTYHTHIHYVHGVKYSFFLASLQHAYQDRVLFRVAAKYPRQTLRAARYLKQNIVSTN